MIKFFRWLIGFVKFRFEKGFSDGFVSDCYREQLAVRNLCCRGEYLFGECPAGQYLALSRLARKHGGRLRVVKRRGLVFPFLKVKKRFGLLVGAVVFAVIVSFFSGFVWHIEIVGNDRISDGEILAFIDENGLREGVWWDGVDKSKIENLMMASFDDCAWVHINEIGTTARVEINETRKKPAVANTKGVANVKATQDGIIVKATVYDGWAAAKVGDSVTKGDLLISGVYEGEDGEKKAAQFAHARGEYIAQVTEPFELVVNRNQSREDFTTVKKYKTLLFFGLKIPLCLPAKGGQNTVSETDYNYIKINDNPIPAGVAITTVKRRQVATASLSDKELTELCSSEIDKKIKSNYADCEVLKKDLDINITADSAVVKGKVTALKNIGREVAVKIEKPKK